MIEDFSALRLSELRIQKNVSARYMSLSLGYSESYINKIGNGKTFPSMQVFFYIFEFSEILPEDVFPEENSILDRATLVKK